MSRPPVIPAEKKIRIVLSVLQGEISIAEAARREKVSEQAIGNWKRQLLEGGKARIEAGMSTARFCRLIDMPERAWRRWQTNARAGRPPKGPWPQPSRVAVRDVVVQHAKAHPAWGHRKIWATTRHD